MENLEYLGAMERTDVMGKWGYLDFLAEEALLEHLVNKESKVMQEMEVLILQELKEVVVWMAGQEIRYSQFDQRASYTKLLRQR